MNANIDLSFGGKQTLLPSSIRVFQVSDGMIVDSKGDRHGFCDLYKDGKTYYDEITKYDNFRPYLDKYLVANVDGNSIKFKQDGTFYIPVNGKDDTSYTSHAYFIKIDTLLPKNMTKPNKGDFLHSQSFKVDGMVSAALSLGTIIIDKKEKE